MKCEYLLDRNRIKRVLHYFKDETFNYSEASEVSDYEVSDEDNIDIMD